MSSTKNTEVPEAPAGFMPPKDIESAQAPSTGGCGSPGFTNTAMLTLLATIAVCAVIMVGELATMVSSTGSVPAPAAAASTIVIETGSGGISSGGYVNTDGTASNNVPDELPPFIERGTNVCAGKKPDLPNTDCIVDAMTNVGPQAGANVTKGYQGAMQVDHLPISTPYWMNGMCPVNVHWHLGAEHLSVGEYDEKGTGPSFDETDGGMREGHLCNLYNETDPKFTKEYQWKYCKLMEVGQTYEVHWPHSAAGACGTPNQYQTPFYDGVFCTDGVLTDTASQIGVQAQVFTIVNDESYFYGDLMRGMIVDGEMGSDIAMYTGSTTGDSRNNEVCSQYSPITWQVDRKCHMISASSFDKLCYDMLQQRDDMSGDLYPHGARETVSDELAANNHNNRFLRV